MYALTDLLLRLIVGGTVVSNRSAAVAVLNDRMRSMSCMQICKQISSCVHSESRAARYVKITHVAVLRYATLRYVYDTCYGATPVQAGGARAMGKPAAPPPPLSPLLSLELD